ncbi:hypothetical protein POMI540_1618 [Schizosaccharomyces pombe]|uniref:UPF0588 membrane protein C20F10.02c n=1 Tax=Schizosaccharomyces pombe (strain 972 / ATCC 24843) TaxID=284812 RepID=YGZ2_SCHPO|nr:uncharacterized protein SPBC20F10.02c [Schizosaccharomyces pombe]O42972.1 RecName: Full=UPF0588 membrane protein C20F10.02c [Schizosaccharomyces pombe 972h-]CAA16842.1 DUF1741 family protein [Schizosaccharomyces pombe]|eukprot:NP_596366.1 uncharacterized protein SPBC20F10.02c [Schizosaccharomyces pombe]
MHRAAAVDTTPKIVFYYKCLLNKNWNEPINNIFWGEFFLLQPRLEVLSQLLRECPKQELTVNGPKFHSMYLYISEILKSKAESLRIRNSLATLQTFLAELSVRKPTDVNFTIFLLLGNIDSIDIQFSAFIKNLCQLVKDSEDVQSVEISLRFVLHFVSFLYNSSFISHIYGNYDVFSTLYTVILKRKFGFETAVYAIGLLSACDKFETVNTFRLGLSKIVDEEFFSSVLSSSAQQLISLRDFYVSIKPDNPLTGSFFNLFSLRSSSNNPDSDQESQFSRLPDERATMFFTIYELCCCNKLFLKKLVEGGEKNGEAPLEALLSLLSYINTHQRQSERSHHFSILSLILFHIIIDDRSLLYRLTDKKFKISVRVCSQRYPYPPNATKPATPLGYMLDICCIGIQHNMKLNLSATMYFLYFSFVYRAMTSLVQDGIRMEYHWLELWRVLFSFLDFVSVLINTSPTEDVTRLLELILDVLAYIISNGDALVIRSDELVDLFYKLLHSSKNFSSFSSKIPDERLGALNYLLEVTEYLTSKTVDLPRSTADEVESVIKLELESIPVAKQNAFGGVPPFKESQYRLFHKRASRGMADLLRRKSEAAN